MDNAKLLVIGAGVNGSAVITKLVSAGTRCESSGPWQTLQ